jgi:formylglycine-generating enzyme required for sulfatase activity
LTMLDLPSEAEWEFAARAGVTTEWLCGDSDTGLAEYAWYSEKDGSTHGVGLKNPNAWELYDVHGNVWEWCLDLYVSGKSGRVLRGGAYSNVASVCAFAYRSSTSPSYNWYSHGLRLFCRPGSN